jgi:hypothetical protein
MTILFLIAAILNFISGLVTETAFLSVTWGVASGIWFAGFINQLEKNKGRKNNG